MYAGTVVSRACPSGSMNIALHMSDATREPLRRSRAQADSAVPMDHHVSRKLSPCHTLCPGQRLCVSRPFPRLQPCTLTARHYEQISCRMSERCRVTCPGRAVDLGRGRGLMDQILRWMTIIRHCNPTCGFFSSSKMQLTILGSPMVHTSRSVFFSIDTLSQPKQSLPGLSCWNRKLGTRIGSSSSATFMRPGLCGTRPEIVARIGCPPCRAMRRFHP